MNKSVAVVVVTYNRWCLLFECLDSLLNQSTPVAAIYVVDNASTDGTEQHLLEHGYLSKKAICYMRMKENIGGAGGFHAGMDRATRDGFEWIWIMDDDAEPKLDALEMMEPLMRFDSVVAVANDKVEINNGNSADHIFGVSQKYSRSAYVRLSFSSFVGLLVRSSSIMKIGLPKKEFFIYGDDNEYCNRLSKIGDIAFAPDSVILHKAVSRDDNRTRHFLGREFQSLSIQRYFFVYFYLRNLLWTCLYSNSGVSERTSYKAVLITYTKVLMKIFLADRDHVYLRCLIVFKAFIDGVRGNFDNAFAFSYPARLAKKPNL
jgi:GT2 family glycosyltransferase